MLNSFSQEKKNVTAFMSGFEELQASQKLAGFPVAPKLPVELLRAAPDSTASTSGDSSKNKKKSLFMQQMEAKKKKVKAGTAGKPSTMQKTGVEGIYSITIGILLIG